MTGQPTTVRVTAAGLRRVLGAVRPFAADPGDLPGLDAVRIEAGSGRLTACATNRFVLGHAHAAADGTLPQVRVPVGHVDHIVQMAAGQDATAEVALTVDGDALTVDTPTASLRTVLAPGYVLPDLTPILDASDYEQVGVNGMVSFMPGILAVVHEALEPLGLGYEGCRLYFRASDKPLRVEVGDWFVALLMPTRMADVEELAQPSVPYGLPDSPIALPQGPAEPLPVTWPQHRSEVTASRLALTYAAETLRRERRLIGGPLDDLTGLPPRPQQAPEQRRQADAVGDLIASMSASFGVALLLRRFAEVAPSAATRAARELWDHLNAGDAHGEQAWEWLTDAGVDPEQIGAEATA